LNISSHNGQSLQQIAYVATQGGELFELIATSLVLRSTRHNERRLRIRYNRRKLNWKNIEYLPAVFATENMKYGRTTKDERKRNRRKTNVEKRITIG